MSLGSELQLSISKKPVSSATLAYHLECPSQKPKTACFLILNGNTVVFIPVNPNYVLLVDSHLHGQTGTFVALCERSSINELLEWYECFNNFFIPVNPNYVLLVDSHLHGQTGTFVALCERSSINELLEWYECFNNFHCSLGTVTVVTFG